jgi:ribosome biogenesis protein Nip4
VLKVPFDPNKPATLGPLSSAEIRENFRALKEDQIVDAGWLSGYPISAFVLKSTPTVITAVHTFNPSTAGAPFTLGANAQGQLITGLNADTVDGQHASAFATATHNHDTAYVRKGTADTITAVHTFSPSTVSAPFILGTNAQGQLVTGLNADTVDGQHASAFATASHNHDTTYVRKGTADTITAVHTFNPSSAGAPFILGSNAQGQLVTGLNADTVDGQHADAFASANHNHDTRYIRKDIAETISVIHTFNPTSTSAPFTLGANAQGQLVTGLNADTVDGQHASAFASSSHNHDTTYVRKGTADTITAVHTFNPSSAGAPFILGSNAQGQLVTGLNADTVDGQHASAFATASHNHDTTYVRKGTADTITAVHTFNPITAGAPFILGSNAQGQLVTGLNADTVDGQHASAFASSSHNHDTSYVRKGTADTITAVHTFNPSSAGAPFILGANAQGQLVTGLNADTVDGQHGDAFVRKSSADTITAVHTFNPSSAGAPFILGSNAQGQLVSGLNADMVDGYHMTDFRRAMTTDITVTVGSGGDFSTINDAINYLVNNFLPPCYRTSSGTPKAKIRILSGTIIAEKIVVDGIDLSWITIESFDSTVTVDLGSSGGPFLIGVENAKLPVINTTFSIYSTNESAQGIYLRNNSEAFIAYSRGIMFSNKGNSVFYLFDGSIIKGGGLTVCQGKSKNNTSYAICALDSMVFLPRANIGNANVLVYGRNSFIRLLGANFGTDYNIKFDLINCDCIPSS